MVVCFQSSVDDCGKVQIDATKEIKQKMNHHQFDFVSFPLFLQPCA